MGLSDETPEDDVEASPEEEPEELSEESPQDEPLPPPEASIERWKPPGGLLPYRPRESVAASFIAQFPSPASRRTMRQGLERIARVVGDSRASGLQLGINDVQWELLRFEQTAYIRGRLLEPGLYERRTVETTLAALRGVLKHAWRLGLMSAEEYTRAIDMPSLPKRDGTKAGRELTQGDLDALRAHWTTQGGAYGAFLGATFALLLGTGLRAAEVCRMPLGAYDGAKSIVHVLRKGGKPKILPLGPEEVRLIDAWLACRADLLERRAHLRDVEELLFRVQSNDWVRTKTPALNVKNLEYLCETLARELKLERFTPHDLRRTFATRLRRAGVDLRVRQWLMSHESPDTTAGYDMGELEEYGGIRRSVNLWTPPRQ